MEFNQNFETLTFNFGKQPKDGKINFLFRYLGENADIYGVQAGCSCLTQDLKVTSEGVEGIWDLKGIPAGVASRNLIVYSNDGEPFTITNENRMIITNSAKVKVQLTLTATIKEDSNQ